MNEQEMYYSLFKEKIIFRDNNGEWILNMNLLKEHNNELYEELCINTRNTLQKLKSCAKDLFEIEYFKIKNFNEVHPISEMRTDSLEEMVNVKGMVTKATKVVAYVEESKWECISCGVNIITKKDDKPLRCSCGNSKKFSLISTTLRNLQEIEIEEPQDELEGKQPQKIRIRLFDELTDKKLSGILQPGNKISVLGILEKSEMKKKIEETLFEYRILGLGVEPLDEQFYDEKLSDEDMRIIQEISADNPLSKLADSLSPSIYGNEEIKKALVLQMAGGVKKQKSDGSISRDRIHILLVGEPGLAKSKMAKSVQLRMPKSYYVSGDETTKVGLAGIVDRDPLLNDWMLQAGALSKASDSTIIIDEIDKMSDEDKEALHTPMETGEISINKASIHTTLKADCSILAIANPKEGMFDLYGGKTITQQINLTPALMSRFDIIFVMMDEIDEKKDFSIAEKIFSQDVKSEISIEMFRKYISYVRKLKPKLRKELMDEISKFYHQIRRKSILKSSTMRGMPITARHLEGIIRLSEASAKLRLSEYVEKEDVEIAKSLFYNFLVKLGMDEETGTIDFARISGGKTLNKKQKSMMILQTMRELMEKFESGYVYDKTLKEECLKRGLEPYEYEELVFQLNKEGEILNTTDGWKLPST